MIYALCIPKPSGLFKYYTLPLQSKPVVLGINLLRCSKEIHNEVSRCLRLWGSTRFLEFTPPYVPAEHSIDMNCSLAMSGLHDLALAKIKLLHLSLNFSTSINTMFGICGLEALQKLRSLWHLAIFFNLETGPTGPAIKGLGDLENLPLVTGLVIRLLLHIPTSVEHVGWHLSHPSIQPRDQYCDYLKQLAIKYESLRGSAYSAQQNSNSF
jgi:hypothetical protein